MFPASFGFHRMSKIVIFYSTKRKNERIILGIYYLPYTLQVR